MAGYGTSEWKMGTIDQLLLADVVKFTYICKIINSSIVFINAFQFVNSCFQAPQGVLISATRRCCHKNFHLRYTNTTTRIEKKKKWKNEGKNITVTSSCQLRNKSTRHWPLCLETWVRSHRRYNLKSGGGCTYLCWKK